MISTDFAVQERFDDAKLALQLILQPWKWKKGRVNEQARQILKRKFFSKDYSIHLFLTGRGALYHCLQALDLPAHSEVIVQAFTCAAVVLPIIECDLKPIYVDINQQTLSLDSALLEEKITKNTRVIIFQHTFGITPEREKLLAIANKYHLLVIEDVAHGFEPGIFKKEVSSSIKLLSFGRSKAFSSVFGGAIATTESVIAKKLAKVEKKLIMPSYWYIFQLLLYKPFSVFIRFSYPFFVGKILHKIVRMLHILPNELSKREKEAKFDHTHSGAYPNALAKLLTFQLEKFTKTAKQQAVQCKKYSSYFSQPQFSQNIQIATDQPLIRYPIRVSNKPVVLNQLRKKGIYLGSWYNQPVDPIQINLFKMQYEKGSCPVAESACQTIINLPTFITEAQRQKILSILEKNLQPEIKK